MHEFVFEKLPTPSCHASTLAETSAGLVAAWFGGTREKHPDVGIWLSRQVAGRWTPPVEVADGVQADGTRHPCWNPVLFQPAKGPLLLFYKVGPSPSAWWGMLRRSTDAGQRWSAAERLPAGVLGPIKNKPVALPNGVLLCPTSTESNDRKNAWRLRFETTPDLGKTWTAAAPAPPAAGQELDAIQPSVLLHPGGRLQALCRTRSGKLGETWSKDRGKTWSAVALTALPNPNSGTDAVTLKDGRHLLVYNHTALGRSPLNVAVSSDGKAWQAALALENEPRAEFSYPAVVQTRDGMVHILYTWKRLRIKHRALDPATLAPRDMPNGKWPAA